MDLREWPPKGITRHPWETARLRFLLRILYNFKLYDKPLKILDAGSGDGWFSQNIIRKMHPATVITCWDSEYTKEKIGKISTVGGSSNRISYTAKKPAEKFDLLFLLDVLEHVNDDNGFLSVVLNENIEDGAFVLVSVPAWQSLYSMHDECLKHVRRYEPRKCQKLLRENGLEIIACGGFFHFLILPRILGKLFDFITGKHGRTCKNAGDWQHGSFLTYLTGKVLFLDNDFSLFLYKLKLNLPGLSWWALCRKNSIQHYLDLKNIE